jgi:hypothetical protein
VDAPAARIGVRIASRTAVADRREGGVGSPVTGTVERTPNRPQTGSPPAKPGTAPPAEINTVAVRPPSVEGEWRATVSPKDAHRSRRGRGSVAQTAAVRVTERHVLWLRKLEYPDIWYIRL